jgi:hypothetical protein
MVVVHETLGVVHMTCWSGSSLAWCISIRVTMTLLNMSGCLSSRSMSCWIDGMYQRMLVMVIFIMMITVLLYSTR